MTGSVAPMAAPVPPGWGRPAHERGRTGMLEWAPRRPLSWRALALGVLIALVLATAIVLLVAR